MIPALYIHTIRVLRFLSDSYNELGEPNFSSSSFVSQGMTEIPCRIETYKEEVEHRDSGERMKNITLIYIDPSFQLLLGDIVVAGTYHTPDLENGDVLGTVDDVTPALNAFGTEIDHYEIRLTNP